MSWRLLPLFAAILLVPVADTSLTHAAEPAAALQTALVQSADRFSAAFAQRDAKALAALFTSEAEYVDADGTVFHGRAAIEAEFAAAFAATPAGTLDISLTSIRPIADGVVVEDGISLFKPKEEGPSSQSRYSAVHVRQADGTWLLASVRELSEPIVTTADRMRDLDWLLGKWREEAAGGAVETEWTRSTDGAALLAKFTIRAADGWWSAGEDGSWSVQLHGVDPLGKRISTLLRYERDGDEALVISQRARTRGGLSLPDVSARVVRQPPEPGPVAAQK